MNILVAEDQETSRYIVSSHLRNWGHNVVEVDNGKAALAHIAGSVKNAIDVLITDWGMPHMDGVELARGLANYSSTEARRLCRKPSSEFEQLLGYTGEPEMLHRDNMVLTGN